jgi:acetyltransferase-like isoleucine patch superfamily enzyme
LKPSGKGRLNLIGKKRPINLKAFIIIFMKKLKNNNKKEKNLMGQIPLEKEFTGLKALRSVFNRLLHFFARALPMYPGWRVFIHRLRGVKIGQGVFIGSDVFIDNTYPESIIIEDCVTVISRTFIIGHNFIPIHFEKILKRDTTTKPGVILRKGCYIGAQCIVLPGVTIGECAIVGAGSVVSNDIPPYSIAMGSPARIIKTFSKDDVIQDYLC